MDVPKWGIVTSVDEVKKIWDKYEDSFRAISKYEMDGLVVSINNITEQEKLGTVDNRPKYAKAFKFSSQIAESTILEVEVQVGRTGRVTPVALIAPVSLSGATISKVSLHNWAEIKRLNLELGQTVKVRRSGDVIPQIIGAIGSGTKKIIPPSNCPSCLKKLKHEEIFVICENPLCPAKHYECLLFWVKTLDIKGFGDELVYQLVEANKVNEPADFYELKVEDISSLERRGEKIAKKVLDELHSKKNIDVETFIKALGIPNVGRGAVELVLTKFDSLAKMMEIKSTEDLVSINGIGETTAKDFIKGLKSKTKVIENLLKHVKITHKTSVTAGKLSGMSFCFTGFRDKDLEKTIQMEGGKVSSGVTKDLSRIVAADPEDATSKIEKAKSHGIEIISVNDLKKMLL